MTIEEIKQTALFKKIVSKNKTELISTSKLYKQQLTHQTIQGRFIYIKLKHELSLEKCKAVSYSKLAQLPFPKLITLYLAENGSKHL
jgi:A/G-specific adenine glycosylase